MAKSAKVIKKSWTVRLRCVVMKEVTCEDCTEQQARMDPFSHATDEIETEQVDWDVRSVKEVVDADGKD